MFEHFLCEDLRSVVQGTRKGGECFMMIVIALFHFFLLPKNKRQRKNPAIAQPALRHTLSR